MDQDELDLRHYLEVLRRRRVAVIVPFVVVVILAMGFTYAQTPLYRAETEVLLRSSTSEDLLADSEPSRNQSTISARVLTEIEYMESRIVERAVIDALGYEPDVTIRANGETEVVTISVSDSTADQAAVAADVYAQTYIDLRRSRLVDEYEAAAAKVFAQIIDLQEELQDAEAPLSTLDAQIASAGDGPEADDLRASRPAVVAEVTRDQGAIRNRLDRARDQLASLDLAASSIETGGAQLISPAEVPESPYAPTPLRNGAVAVVVGLILGIGVAFLYESLDDRFHGRAELEDLTGWPVLGVAHQINPKKLGGEGHLVAAEMPDSAAAEAYRTLRTSVQFAGVDRELRSILVTSSNEQEGKTTTVANLGVTLAKAGHRVILADCDLRRPRLHSYFGLPNDHGLTSVLMEQVELAAVMRQVTPDGRLAVLPAGPTPPNLSELLALRRTHSLLSYLRSQFDFLLIDTPPILPVSDAAVLSRSVDGVIVVVNAQKTRRSHVRSAAEVLTSVRAPVIGLVLNEVSDRAGGYGYYGGYSNYAPAAKTGYSMEELETVISRATDAERIWAAESARPDVPDVPDIPDVRDLRGTPERPESLERPATPGRAPTPPTSVTPQPQPPPPAVSRPRQDPTGTD